MAWWLDLVEAQLDWDWRVHCSNATRSSLLSRVPAKHRSTTYRASLGAEGTSRSSSRTVGAEHAGVCRVVGGSGGL